MQAELSKNEMASYDLDFLFVVKKVFLDIIWLALVVV